MNTFDKIVFAYDGFSNKAPLPRRLKKFLQNNDSENFMINVLPDIKNSVLSYTEKTVKGGFDRVLTL